MALALEMMRGGISAGGAKAINGAGGIQASVSAAGTTISDATPLVSSTNLVGTVAAGSGVGLPNSEIGDEVIVYNNQVTENLLVYPPSSATINQLSASTGMLLPPYTACKFKKLSATVWVAWKSA